MQRTRGRVTPTSRSAAKSPLRTRRIPWASHDITCTCTKVVHVHVDVNMWHVRVHMFTVHAQMHIHAQPCDHVHMHALSPYIEEARGSAEGACAAAVAALEVCIICALQRPQKTLQKMNWQVVSLSSLVAGRDDQAMKVAYVPRCWCRNPSAVRTSI